MQEPSLNTHENSKQDLTPAKLPVAFRKRGTLWGTLQEHDKAIADFSEAIRLEPTLAYAYFSRGTVWETLRQYAKAIADYKESIHRDPEEVTSYLWIANIYASCPVGKFRDGTMAVEYARTGCKLTHWQNEAHVRTLAAAHAEAGEFSEAIRRQEQLIAMYDIEENHIRLELYKKGKPYHWKAAPATDGQTEEGTDENATVGSEETEIDSKNR